MRVPLITAAVLLALTGCGTDSTSTATSSAPATTGPVAAGGTTVEIKNFTFTPQQLTVAVGTTVTWTFADTAKHNVKATDRSFSSNDLSDGATFTHTFDKPGEFPYICSLHQYMTGTITVR
ncbi:cupredoxin domain-containing protein [Actinokineospora diospyrosa]|uniref:Plastocyanin n=1 Tax=Actinokineospora diospyrosa TaxID=103728 RepID=A0ABT1IEL3_9PSEU|nr:cupredoxin family copper-binding protein [Actinokineospora diospyrosa]MCP2271073.1 Plastocyanin [Actinokineospora diospyrosa]